MGVTERLRLLNPGKAIAGPSTLLLFILLLSMTWRVNLRVQ